jgi:hypothetical protein
MAEIKRVRYITENYMIYVNATEDCNRLLEACDKHLQPVITPALHAAMRKDEILNLK